MANKTRVLILGGGFGGLYAALEFEKRRDPRFEVTVVNRENFCLFTPMLHEIAASDLDRVSAEPKRNIRILSRQRLARRQLRGYPQHARPIDLERIRSRLRLVLSGISGGETRRKRVGRAQSNSVSVSFRKTAGLPRIHRKNIKVSWAKVE
jgi:2-polyprenyl-6-methoxyphenol hydroxylase-like FAD-dependent oxidoreductase